jgi:phosphohistidine swiveling domain-containing protein
MKEYCLELNAKVHKLNLKLVGNKAYNLAKFVETVKVPKGFIVTTYVYNSLRKVLSDKGVFRYAKLYADDKLSKAAYLAKISECFRDIEFKASVQDEILNWAKRIGGRLVVRSSATQEDLSARSFAGIFDSFLDVKPLDVPIAIKNVFKSMFSPRAIKYIVENGMQIEKMEMACIVQEFIPNAKYGVGFFFEKMANKYCVIEAVIHDPAGITSGSKKHDTYIKNIKSNDILHYNAESSKSILFDFEIEDIIKLMKNIGNKIFPLDIEWAYTYEGLFLLQARAITTTIPIRYGNQSFNCLGVSSGTCSGEAVIYDSEKSDNLIKGKNKILVAGDLPIEDSQIIKDFGGVVLELAGITSHVAILAREYKIPCITGLDKATQIIKQSEHIQIDGNSGAVTFLDRKGLIANNKFKAAYAKPDKLFIFEMKGNALVVEKYSEVVILHYNPSVHKGIRDIVKSVHQKFNLPVLNGSVDVWQRYWILLEVSGCDKKIAKDIYKGVKVIKSLDINKIDFMVNKFLRLASIYYMKSELMYIMYKRNKNGKSIKSIRSALYYSYYAFSYWGIASNVMLRDGMENALLDEPDERKKSKLQGYVYKINLDEQHPLHKIGDNIVHLIDDIYVTMKEDKINVPQPFCKLWEMCKYK